MALICAHYQNHLQRRRLYLYAPETLQIISMACGYMPRHGSGISRSCIEKKARKKALDLLHRLFRCATRFLLWMCTPKALHRRQDKGFRQPKGFRRKKTKTAIINPQPLLLSKPRSRRIAVVSLPSVMPMRPHRTNHGSTCNVCNPRLSPRCIRWNGCDQNHTLRNSERV